MFVNKIDHIFENKLTNLDVYATNLVTIFLSSSIHLFFLYLFMTLSRDVNIETKTHSLVDPFY